MGDKTRLPFPVFLLAALPPVLLPGAAGFTPSLDSDFTFTLPAGRKECFYQPMPLKASLEIEYQVSAQGGPAFFLEFSPLLETSADSPGVEEAGEGPPGKRPASSAQAREASQAPLLGDPQDPTS